MREPGWHALPPWGCEQHPQLGTGAQQFRDEEGAWGGSEGGVPSPYPFAFHRPAGLNSQQIPPSPPYSGPNTNQFYPYPWEAGGGRGNAWQQGFSKGETGDVEWQQKQQQRQHCDVRHDKAGGERRDGVRWSRLVAPEKGIYRSSSVPGFAAASDSTRPLAGKPLGLFGNSSSSGRSLRPIWCLSIAFLVWITIAAIGSMIW